MPRTEVIFYQAADGSVPVREWLLGLKARDRPAFAKCVAKIQRLEELGYELRRPEADILRDGIHELRVRHRRDNYRILYFFHGQNVSILAHAVVKEDVVPASEIERAIRRKVDFLIRPDRHTFRDISEHGRDQ